MTNTPRRRGRPPLPPELRKRPKSGAQKKRERLERELGAAIPQVSTPSVNNVDDVDFVTEVRRLGPPPEDPIDAIVWGNRLAAVTAWAAGIGPLTPLASARRRGVLDAIKALGFTNAKAVDKKLMLRIAERLGLKAKDADGELEPVTEGTSFIRA